MEFYETANAINATEVDFDSTAMPSAENRLKSSSKAIRHSIASSALYANESDVVG